MRNSLPDKAATSSPPVENLSLGSDGLTESQRDFARVVARALAQKWRQLQSKCLADITTPPDHVLSPSHSADGSP